MTMASTHTASIPQHAMVLAAGLGERMRPLTDERPKPLLELRRQALIDAILDQLDAAGVSQVVVNVHYLGHMIEAHLRPRERPRIALSQEETRLETGGGVRQALPLLGTDPFYVINGDVSWLDGRTPALRRMADAWDEARMDALLLVHPTAVTLGYEGLGDYVLSPDGRLRRRREREVAPFVFAGIQILHPRLFEGAPDGAFSLNLIYDKAEGAGRLQGLRHDGEWFHLSTPDQLRQVEDALSHLDFHTVQK